MMMTPPSPPSSPHPLRSGGRDSAPTSHFEQTLLQATHTHTVIPSTCAALARARPFPHLETRLLTAPPPPCEQLSRPFTGSDGLEKFPVGPTAEEKNTHTSGCSASASITPPPPARPPLFYWESHLRGSLFSRRNRLVGWRWDVSVCVGAGFLCWNRWL